MAEMRSRSGILVGLAAAVGAFGAAVMMSAATAPTARADDLTEIVNAVDGDFADGTADFNTAFGDFSGGDVTDGLAAVFNGVNDDALSAPNNLVTGLVEALTNEGVNGAEPWSLSAEVSFSDALTTAEDDFGTGESDFTVAASNLALGGYGDAALYDLFGADFVSIVPLEELLLGVAASF